MNSAQQKKMIGELLGDTFTQEVLQELGVQNSSREAQEEVLAKVGQTILERVMLEILTVLPESDRDMFESYVGSGDLAGMRSFLEPRIPNLDEFVLNYANIAFESIKTRIHQLAQGVE